MVLGGLPWNKIIRGVGRCGIGANLVFLSPRHLLLDFFDLGEPFGKYGAHTKPDSSTFSTTPMFAIRNKIKVGRLRNRIFSCSCNATQAT